MIRIEKNAETVETIQELRNNTMKPIQFWEMLKAYKDKEMTPSVELELLKQLERFGYHTDSLKIPADEYYGMEYNKNIKLDEIKAENVEIKTYELRKYHLEPIDFGNTDQYLNYYNRIGYYDKDIQAPVIIENGQSWMSPTLAEKNTIQDAIDRATGNVLTFGMGIGYFPYNCSLKNEVQSITIVERNERIIEIFKTYILPQFQSKKEIIIIHGDMFDYLNTEFLNQYDYVFVDIWKNEIDGFEIYEKIMKQLPEKITVKMDYWIEDTIHHTVRKMVAIYLGAVLDDRLTEQLSSFPDDFKGRHVIRMVHRYFRTRDDLITNKEQILYFINNKQVLREILKK